MDLHADLSASAPTASELFNTEEALISMYELHKSAGYATTDIEEAYEVVAKELGSHGLWARGLRKDSTAPPPARSNSYPDSGTLWTTEGVRTGRGGNRNRTQDASGVAQNDDEMDDDDANDSAQNEDNDFLSKAYIRFEKASGFRPAVDPQGYRVVFKEWNAEQRKAAAKSGEALPDGSFPIKSHGDLSDAVHLFKTGHQGPDPGKTRAHIVSRARALGAPDPFSSPIGKAARGTDVNGGSVPARPAAPDDNGPTPEDNVYVPHPYKPSAAVASICATCGRPIADHVGKYLGADRSFKEAADQVAAYHHDIAISAVNKAADNLPKPRHSVEERQRGAQTGLALPDGSFYIPDEAALHEAIRLIAYAADPMQAMNHIVERGQSMGMEHALPPAWRVDPDGTQEPEPPTYGPGAHSMDPSAPPMDPNAGRPGNNDLPLRRPNPPKSPGVGGSYRGHQLPSDSPNINKALAVAFKKAYDAGFDTNTAVNLVESASSNTFEQFAVVKRAEQRFTLGPVYMPNQYDAHGEWTGPEDLTKALHDYVRETGADRRIYLQHSDKPAGEWLEVVQWPFPQRATLKKSINGVQKSYSMEFPAGTIYLGAKWEPWAWEEVKKENITGFSMGGWAQRLEMAIQQFDA